MKFRRDSISYLYNIISVVACSCFSVVGIIWLSYDKLLVLIFIVLPTLSTAILAFLLTIWKTYIVVDAIGITCSNEKGIVWEYKWSEIQCLEKCVINKSTCLVIKPMCGCNKYHTCIEPVMPYFQLGIVARKAIKKYCTVPIKK